MVKKNGKKNIMNLVYILCLFIFLLDSHVIGQELYGSAPIVYDKSVRIYNSQHPFAISLHATDEDSDQVTFKLIEPPEHGSYFLEPSDQLSKQTVRTGGIIYTPIEGYVGSDSFTFKAVDEHGFVSNTATVSLEILPPLNNPYDPPIGIPKPEFGIEETHYMYENAIYDYNENPGSYKDAGNGPYTHYIDNSNPAATDRNNPYGTAELPRQTLPKDSDVQPGAVIEIHGESYEFSWIVSRYNGTVEKPVFVRGVGDPLPLFKGSGTINIAGHYVIWEDLNFYEKSLTSRVYSESDDAHHISVRNCHVEMGSVGAVSFIDDTQVHNMVIYNNTIKRDDFDPESVSFPEKDSVGVYCSLRTTRVWVLENDIYQAKGDAVGGGHAVKYLASNYYIGRNELHQCGENAVDFKEVENIILSENKMYDFEGWSSGAGGDGTAAVVHYGPQYSPKNVWFLFNEIYDADGAIQAGGDQVYPVYIIGNIIHDLHDGNGTAEAFRTWSCREVYFSNNIIYDVDNGIDWGAQSEKARLIFNNNIISYTEDDGYALKVEATNQQREAEINNNVFYRQEGPVSILWGRYDYTVEELKAATGKGVGSIESDPLFISADAVDFMVRENSPCIDSGVGDSVYQIYEDRFGIDIRKDFAGNTRPQGDGWDIGAYEYEDNRPVITKEPLSQTVLVGKDAGFSVEAYGHPEPTYQWQKRDGDEFINLQDEITDILMITDVNNNDEGEYRVKVLNNLEEVISRSVTLEIIDALPEISDLRYTPENNTVYLSWNNPAGQGEDWEKVLIVRKKDEVPANPDDGDWAYSSGGTSVVDSNMDVGKYYYAGFTYKEYENNIIYSAKEEAGPVEIPERIYNKKYYAIRANQGNQILSTGQSTRGDLYSFWNKNDITIGRGPTGNVANLCLYSDIIGFDENQIPSGSEIVSARLIFNVEESSFKSSSPHSTSIYQITDPDSQGMPYYAKEDGVRTGLDFYYRDHRPGINKSWMAVDEDIEVSDIEKEGSILKLFEDEEALDYIEFLPEVFEDVSAKTLQFDITEAVQDWTDGQINQGLYITIDDGWMKGEELVLSGVSTDDKDIRPILEIIYVNSGENLIAPDAVREVGVSPGESSITLNWINPDINAIKNADLAGVKIIRREGIIPYGPYDGQNDKGGVNVIFVEGNDITGFTDTGLERGKTYYYDLYTYDTDHNYSNGVWVKAIPGVLTEVPVPVVNSLNIDAGQVSFSWEPVTGADTYRVYRKDISGGISGDGPDAGLDEYSEIYSINGRLVSEIEAVENERTIFTEPLLKGNYIYQITAVNQYGEGPLSEEIEVTVDENNGAGQEPADPSNLEGKILAELAVELSWNDNSDNESIFVVERQNENDEWGVIGISGYDDNTYIDREIPEIAQLSYRVKAVNSAGNSEYSNVMEIDIPLSNISWKIISASQIRVEWTGILESGVYKLELNELRGNGKLLDTQYISGNISGNASDNPSENTNYCYFVNLEPGREYWVEISFNLDGEMEDNEITVQSDIIRTVVDSKGGLF